MPDLVDCAKSLFRNSWPACKVRVRSMTEAAERWSACSIATGAWPRTWRQPAHQGVSWRSQGRWRRARPHRPNSETGSKREHRDEANPRAVPDKLIEPCHTEHPFKNTTTVM